jgi:hypothetical protein
VQMSRHPLFLTLGLLAVVGCNCQRGPGPASALPDFTANPTVLSFESCPSQDETGAAVADVFPAVQTFTIENIGRVPGPLSVTLQGKDAALFQIVQSTLVESINNGEGVEIQVQFAPTAAGDATAELVIDDGYEETDPVKVTLSGMGSTLPAQPKIKISYQDKDSGEFVECLESFNGSIDNCMVLWPDTYKEQSTTLKMKIENLGCPTLKVTGIELLPYNPGEDVQFFLDKPNVPPSDPTPALLSLADGTQQMELEVRFAPQDNTSPDGQRYAYMKVLSNSVTSPESNIMLFGNAAEPSLYSTPTFCDYTGPGDCQGTRVPTTGQNSKSVFQILNGGNTPVTIESVALRNLAPNRFKIGAANPQGKTIQPGASEPLEIEYTDAPLYVTELLDIKGTSQSGTVTMPTNTVTIRLQGGVLPCLFTEPGDTLDFSGTAGKAEKPLEICNRSLDLQGNACGVLNINNVQVTQGMQFFKVKTPSPAGATVDPGACATATIEFTPPVTGGVQAGTLDLTTNDPDYTPYRVNLLSDKPVDMIPVAVVTGPPPAKETPSMSVELSTLPPPPQHRVIDIYGTDSYDPPNMGPIVKWSWYLERPNGSAADLVQGGVSVHNKETTTGVVQLDFDPLLTGSPKTGLYKVHLTVFDSANQRSATRTLEIDVRP